ncbi:MAG TPA: response regulator [Afifellaceae bacterium]|nr:response regulator [Afifellaceae bacterium]
MRILLTEDDEAVRGFVSRALELDGHDVDTADDGMEALALLEASDGGYDLLVSDVKMPMMDGIALAHSAAERWPGMRILLMTGFADQRERADDLSKVIRDVVTKPFTLQEIREAVSDAAEDQGIDAAENHGEDQDAA